MSFIDTNYLHIFPLGKNRPSDRSSRLFYENNVANLIRQLIDTEGFIVNWKNPEEHSNQLQGVSNNSKTVLKFNSDLNMNLFGYFISVATGATIDATLYNTGESLDDLTANESKVFSLYVKLKMESEERVAEIQGQDVEQKYEGLSFDIVDNETCSVYESSQDNLTHFLKICTFRYLGSDDNKIVEFEIIPESTSKFGKNSLKITEIDGKH